MSSISHQVFERYMNEWLQYLIKYLRDIAHMSEKVSAIPQGLNWPASPEK